MCGRLCQYPRISPAISYADEPSNCAHKCEISPKSLGFSLIGNGDRREIRSSPNAFGKLIARFYDLGILMSARTRLGSFLNIDLADQGMEEGIRSCEMPPWLTHSSDRRSSISSRWNHFLLDAFV